MKSGSVDWLNLFCPWPMMYRDVRNFECGLRF